MKTFRLAVVAVFFSASAFAQSEGVAEFKGTMSGGQGQTVPSTGKVYFKKEIAYRTEWEMDLTALAQKERGASKGMMPTHSKWVMIQKLSDLDHIITVNDETKTYSITDLKKMREGMPESKTTWTVKKLGRDSVAGHPCEKASVTASTGSEMEICVSTEFFPSAAFLAAQNRQRSGNFLTVLQENGLNGFPIRWSVKDKKEQRVVATMELARFERKSVPSSLFEIPAGYRETSGMGVMMTPEQQKAVKDAMDQMTPEQRKAMKEALEKMTPEQRKMYEEIMKKQ